MQKSSILALALVVMGAVFFVAWRALRSDPAGDSEHEAGIAGPSSPAAPERTDDTAHATPARLEVPGSSSRVPDVTDPAARLRTLRVHVSYSSPLDQHPAALEVRAASRSGQTFDLHQRDADDYVSDQIQPGPYVVAATAHGFKRTVVHIDVARDPAETVAEVVLTPMRILHVSWFTSDGQPIGEVLGAVEVEMGSVKVEDDLTRVEVFASLAPITEDGPPPERCAFASIAAEFALGQDGAGHRFARNLLALPGRSSPTNETPGTFGFLEVEESGPIWVSAWRSGALVGTQQVEPAQTEVVFRTPIENLAVKRTPVSIAVVDDESGAPIDDAALSFGEEGRLGGLGPLRLGIHGLELQPGWKTMYVSAEGHADAKLRFRVPSTGTVDLGTVRLSPDTLFVAFHVVDAASKPVDVAIFELVRLSSYDGSGAPYDTHREWSGKPQSPQDARGNQPPSSANRSATAEHGQLVFSKLPRDRYLLRCVDVSVSARPLVIEPSAITSDRTRVAGEITVTPQRRVTFVFTSPQPPDTLLMIETLDGLPVRTLETNEFDIVTTALGGTDYSLHLVDAGRATPAVRFTVDTDPFVFEIEH